jgi:hypothetical protein
MLLGVNFSHRHARWLGQDPDQILRLLLDDLGARSFRVSVYWDEVAPAPGKLEFEPVRRWLDPLERAGARTIVTVGLKAQRWPEYYPPEWISDGTPLPRGANLDAHPRVITHLLLMLERLTAFLADYGTVEAWQVENEPFLPGSTTVGWLISPALLQREIEVVRSADPRRRPVVVNHSTHSRFDDRWQTALLVADVLGENVYTRRPTGRRWPPYANPHSWGPLAPPLRRQARLAHELGREFWITELQAEPWERGDVHGLTPARVGSVSPRRIESNLRLVRAAGADRIYLWGAEWWRFTADRDGDTRYWDLANRLFNGGSAPATT